jgi:citrate synthase
LNVIPSAPAALAALGGILVGGAVYACMLILLRIPEVSSIFGFLRRRLIKQ